MLLKALSLLTFLLTISSFPFVVLVAEDLTADERLLSRIELPRASETHSNGSMDVSNDRRRLYYAWSASPNWNPELEKTWKTVEATIHLLVYDISDPYNPHQITSLSITPADVSPAVGPFIRNLEVHGNKMFLHTIYSWNTGHRSDLLIYDIQNPAVPMQIGSIPDIRFNNIRISKDGSKLMDPFEKDAQVYDISDLRSLVSTTIPGDFERIKIRGIRHINDGGGLDEFDNIMADTEPETSKLQLWDAPEQSSPTLIREVALGFYPDAVRVISEDRVFILAGRTGVTGIYNVAPFPISAERLRANYQKVLKQYDEGMKKEPQWYNASPLIDMLEASGVANLISDTLPGLEEAERINVLNDYGFWLSQHYSKSSKALPILRKVVELAPDRQVAWLNLGDSARSQIPRASTEVEKAELANEAHNAYQRYKKLSGKNAGSAAYVESLVNFLETAKQSGNVCDYAAAAYNSGVINQVIAVTGTVTISGTPVTFRVGMDSGSCTVRRIEIVGKTQEESQEILQKYHFASNDWGGFDTGMDVLPYAGKSYTIEYNQGPILVIDPFTGPVCSLEKDYTPALVEDKDPAICKKFLAGKLPENTDWKPAPDNEDAEFAHPDKVVTVNWNGKPTQIGHVQIDDGAGCGHSYSRFVLMDGDKRLKGPKAEKFDGMQDELANYRYGYFSLINIKGETYVSLEEHRRKSLLQPKGDKLEAICRVEESMSVTLGAPPAKSMRDLRIEGGKYP